MGAPGVIPNGGAAGLVKPVLVFLGRWVTGPYEQRALRQDFANHAAQNEADHAKVMKCLGELRDEVTHIKQDAAAIKGHLEGFKDAVDRILKERTAHMGGSANEGASQPVPPADASSGAAPGLPTRHQPGPLPLDTKGASTTEQGMPPSALHRPGA